MVCMLNVFTYKQHNIKRKAENESLKKTNYLWQSRNINLHYLKIF